MQMQGLEFQIFGVCGGFDARARGEELGFGVVIVVVQRDYTGMGLLYTTYAS